MEKTLKRVFGFDSFRKGQREAAENILKGKDVLAVMPTGAGKSICYQLPAVMNEGITIVISPLVSLMADQVKNLINMGIRGAYLNSSLTYRQYCKALENAKAGVYKIIYVAPERLETKEFKDFALNADISIISIDEAHCVSQWGQDFRPSYLKIKGFIQGLKKRPVICAFTATATNEVKRDIVALIGLNNPFTIETGFDRPNLYFGTKKSFDKKKDLINILKRHNNESGIIYCATRKLVEEVCSFLKNKDYNAVPYHAGIDANERKLNQEDFIFDRKKIIVATNAFGMGIDKSDVRFVIHYNMPRSLEYYYQEAGRAGRDGERAECILLYEPSDYGINRYFIENIDKSGELPEEQRNAIIENELKKLNQMKYYSTTNNCLRSYMLYYFGENNSPKCGNCSNCINEERVIEQANQRLDYNLVAILKKYRKDIAKRNHMPAAMLFTDAVIRELALKRPMTKIQMSQIAGMNSFKLKKYGDELLEIIIDYEKGEL